MSRRTVSKVTAIGATIIAASLISACSFEIKMGEEPSLDEETTSENDDNSNNESENAKSLDINSATFGEEDKNSPEYLAIESLSSKLNTPEGWEKNEKISRTHSMTDNQIQELTMYKQVYGLSNASEKTPIQELKSFIENNSNVFDNIEFIGYLEDSFIDGNVVLAKVTFEGKENVLLVSSEEKSGIYNSVTLVPYEDFVNHKNLSKYTPFDL